VAKPLSTGPARKRRRAALFAAGLGLFALASGLLLAYRAGRLVRLPQFSSEQRGPSALAETQPVPEAVLDELRRAEAAQQANLEFVRAHYEAEHVSGLEVCAAEVLLIEAHIKLANAERKPVVALLEDLVRVREDELDQIEMRIDAGALAEADGMPAKALLSDARARLATARADSPPVKPFILQAADGRTEAEFATLAEAIGAAGSGDAIEIRRNGPIVVDPIRVPVALAVRAADGYRPVIQLSPEGVASNGAILNTESPLILEGLEFHRRGGPSKATETPYLIQAQRTPLQVAHCRFSIRGEGNALLVTCPAEVTARNCIFEDGHDTSCALGLAQAGRSKVHIEQCLFTGRTAIVFMEPTESMSVTFVNNSAWCKGPLLHVSQGSSKAGSVATSKNPLQVHASANVLYVAPDFLRPPADKQVIDLADAEPLRTGIVRLDSGKPGKGAGPGGTDIGADLRLAGPGEPYQRWSKAPEYREWRKKTNALMQAKNPPSEVP
jgi:hypothetical protein